MVLHFGRPFLDGMSGTRHFEGLLHRLAAILIGSSSPTGVSGLNSPLGYGPSLAWERREPGILISRKRQDAPHTRRYWSRRASVVRCAEFGELPRSADQTQSPAVVSQKREFFGMRPETFGNFAAPLAKSGGWRPCTKLEKPAIGGYFSDY